MNNNKKTINRTIRFSKKEIEKIDNEIQSNEEINSVSDLVRVALNLYFEQHQYKEREKINKKVNYIDETTAINLLMTSDVIANQLGFSDDDRLEYIQSKKEELEKIMRFDGKLF